MKKIYETPETEVTYFTALEDLSNMGMSMDSLEISLEGEVGGVISAVPRL